MVYVYLDIETTGLDIDKCNFTCGVAICNNVVFTFETAVSMVAYLTTLPKDAIVVTFNGLAFDLPFLAKKIAQASADVALTQQLAHLATHNHIDIMYAFACTFGYFTSLQSFATPLGIAKTWSGAAAAASTDLPKIIEYCTQDVKVLQQVHQHALTNGKLDRVTQRGHTSTWTLLHSNQIPLVSQCSANIQTMPPDQNWMDNPPNLIDLSKWATM